MILLLLAPLAWADDDHHGGDDLGVTNDLTASLVGGENRSLALSGGSLGDVDINGCLGSTQFSIFVLFAKQSLKIDALCVADKYDQVGRHQLAAQLRCQVPLIANLDYSGSNCIDANTFETPPDPTPTLDAAATASMVAAAEHDDDDDALVHDTAAALAALQAQLDQERRARRSYVTQQAEVEANNKQAAADMLVRFQEVAKVPDQ